MTERLYLRDAYLRSFSGTVVEVVDVPHGPDGLVWHTVPGGNVAAGVGLDKQADGGTHVRRADEVLDA